MADKNGDCSNEDSESQVQICGHRLKGPEKELQSIFKKLRVDNGPKRLHRKARLGGLGNLGHGDNGSRQRIKRILRQPTFIYKNQQASIPVSVYRNQHIRGIRHRRRKMSLELKTKEILEHQRDSHSDSELEYSKSVAAKSKSRGSEGLRKAEQRLSHSVQIAVGCGRQHSRLQCANVPRMNFDDTTPEELASYFDQLLYFPKPMSAMAEMMYT